jgi:hypothetical protein
MRTSPKPALNARTSRFGNSPSKRLKLDPWVGSHGRWGAVARAILKGGSDKKTGAEDVNLNRRLRRRVER